MVRIQKRTARNNNIRRYRKSVHKGGMWGTVTGYANQLKGFMDERVPGLSEEFSAIGTAALDTVSAAALEAKVKALKLVKKTSVTIMVTQITAMFAGLTKIISDLKKASEEKANLIGQDLADKVAKAEQAYNVMVATYTQFLFTFFVNFMELFTEVITTAREELNEHFDDDTRKSFNRELSNYAKKTIVSLPNEQRQIFFVVISMLSDLINPKNPTMLATPDELDDRLNKLLIVDQKGGRSYRRY
jgi:hypothetical protein